MVMILDSNSDKQKNISQVANDLLCNTCGGCLGICPSNAIAFHETKDGYYLPIVDEEICTRCGICYEVCPGIHFGKTLMSNMPDDPFAGRTLSTFVGKAANKQLFDNSQSGGIVSAILVHALETGLIKGAVTAYMQARTPPRPVVRIARNKQQVIEAQKSKYCPVPLLGFLQDLKKDDDLVAVVGVSCQIHALINILDKYPKLKNKIAFTIGLVCDRVLSYSALNYLTYKAASKEKSKANMIHYRDKSANGYPGDVHVYFENGKSIVLPASTRMRIREYFTPARCRLCFDKMNVFSDITVGDPHGLEGVDRKRGESMLVVRTTKGQAIVESAKNDKAINIRVANYDVVVKGQNIMNRKKHWGRYVAAWQQLGRTPPNYCKHMKSYVPEFSEDKDISDLQHAIQGFELRDAFVRLLDNHIAKKQISDKLLFPVRLTKKMLRKILTLAKQ